MRHCAGEQRPHARRTTLICFWRRTKAAPIAHPTLRRKYLSDVLHSLPEALLRTWVVVIPRATPARVFLWQFPIRPDNRCSFLSDDSILSRLKIISRHSLLPSAPTRKPIVAALATRSRQACEDTLRKETTPCAINFRRSCSEGRSKALVL